MERLVHIWGPIALVVVGILFIGWLRTSPTVASFIAGLGGGHPHDQETGQ